MATRTRKQELTMGALVDYYTEPSDKHAARWRGPATIVALERDLVLVRHGAGYFGYTLIMSD